MKRYLKIYRQLIRLNLAALLTYRVNFVNNILASIVWGLMSLYTVIMLTARITDAYGWKREELLLFNGVYGVIVGIFHMFISINMGRLSRVIHVGELDGILVKPIDSQFAVSFWWINFAMIFRILIALVYTIWIIGVLHITISVSQLVLFVFLAFGSLALLYSLWFGILTNLIWFSNMTNLVLFMYSFESMARFPKEMLMQLSSYIFAVILPLALVINTPARALLGKLSFLDASILMLIAIVFWVIARTYWRFALRHYTSASS
ncbi:MAG TPA: ABC-2 family transporter protein [Patescibacteria group bacterium]|nr:ABC-2 family transporter protein [Patescibacteria group bacterium]